LTKSTGKVVVGVWEKDTSDSVIRNHLESLLSGSHPLPGVFMAANVITDNPAAQLPVAGEAYPVSLFTAPTLYEEWQGSGTFTVVICILDFSGNYYAYQIDNVSITKATTSVPVPGTPSTTW